MKQWVFLCCFLLVGLAACHRGANSSSGGHTVKQTGKASYYADKFNGKPTASGEPYNSSKLTAAHRTLPFGTMVKVVNLRNQKEVVVRINDRGPFAAGRIIDLSKAAAQKIDMLQSGIVEVTIFYKK
jgi:rare lipoprotein A